MIYDLAIYHLPFVTPASRSCHPRLAAAVGWCFRRRLAAADGLLPLLAVAAIRGLLPLPAEVSADGLLPPQT